MKLRTHLLLGFLCTGLCISASLGFAKETQSSGSKIEIEKPPVRPDPKRFSADIAKFALQKLPEDVAKGGIVFTGSSSIRMWKLQDYFADLPVLNRGFGGSAATDSIYFIRETILDYAPKVVVLYTGSNDINNRLPVDEAFDNYQKLLEQIHAALPQTHVIINAVKTGNQRVKQMDQVAELNKRLEQWASVQSWAIYTDTASYLLGEDGKPDDSYFLSDQLHLNKKGYDKWFELLEPVLKQVWEGVK